MRQTNVREKLLNAGLETLYQKGFNATSVQDITDAAGVPKGSFYNHFESKEQLGVEVVDSYLCQGVGAFTSAEQLRRTPVARIEAYFRGMMQRSIENQFCTGCLLGNFGAELSNQSEAIRLKLAEAFQAWSGELAQQIAQAQQSGEISSQLPAEMLAGFLLNAWQGVLVRARVERSPQALEDFIELLRKQILI